MKRLFALLVGVASLAPLDFHSAMAAAERPAFVISVDESARAKWGLRYPVTYVFRLSDPQSGAEAWRRDGPGDPWARLPEKSPGDLFNGVECVRFDREEGKAYVSVGFLSTSTVEIEFARVGSAAFGSIARYYDHRKAVYTLSNDNWCRRADAHPGAPWQGMTDDRSDKYQASIHACREFGLPVSIGVNSRAAGGEAMWARMQEELDRGDRSWEPAVHSRTHPCSAKAYSVGGYGPEILGCRDDILERLANIPYGQHVFEFILPCGYKDPAVEKAAQGEFLFVRDWNGHDNPASTDYAPWDAEHAYYGIGGLQTASYDSVLEKRSPKGRYYAADAAALDRAFDRVYEQGGIFYAMWHADRYQNSVIYDPRPGVDGVQGSTLMQHFAHVAGRRDVWYVANGWLYSYRYAAQHAQVR
jgi:hypothetical protein